MSLTGCTILPILPSHTPNEGRVIINDNFECLQDSILNFSGITSGITGSATHIQPGLNTYTGGTSQYPTVNISGLTIDNINSSGSSVFNNITANGNVLVVGDVEIQGNTTVYGTATTIHSQTLQVEDNIIYLNYSGNNVTAQGGGIVLISGQTNGSSSSILTDSEGNWIFNPGLSANSISATTFYSGSTDLSLLLGSNSVLYTNSGATPTTIGGISAGSTFSNKTMQEMWDALLYPYQVPAFSSFSRTNLESTYEVGQLLVAGAQTFTWATTNSSNVSANTISIVQNFAPITTLLSSSANDGTEALVLSDTYSAATSTSVTLYTISAVNSLNNSFSTTISRNWRHKRYWGTHPSFTLPSDSDIINADGASVGAGNEFSTTRVQTRNGIDGAGNYLFFAWPTSFGTPTFTVNGLPNSAWTKIGNAISFTNAQGFVESYDVWISNTAQFSPITLFSIS